MTSDEPGPPDDHPAADGKPKPQVDGPTVMGPTVGHLHGATPGTPAEPPPVPPNEASPADPPAGSPTPGNSPLDEPTVAGPALGSSASAWAPRQHAGTSTPPPADEPTIGGLARPTFSQSPPDDSTIADARSGSPAPPPSDEPTIRPGEPSSAAAPPEAPATGRPGLPDEPTIATPAGNPNFAATPPETASTGKPDLPDEPTLATPVSAANEAPPPSDEPTVTGLGPGSPYPAEPTTVGTPSFTSSSPSDEATIRVPSEPTGEPTSGWPAPASQYPAEPGTPGEAIGEPGPSDEATIAVPGMFPPADETTIVNAPDAPTTPSVDEETVRVDGPTMAIAAEDVTTTGPTVGGWPFDEPEPPPLPTDLIWRSDPPPSPAEQREPRRSPAYYIGLGAAVVIVVGLVAVAAVVSVVRPTVQVAGSAHPTQGIPEITTTTTNPPPTTTAAPEGPLTEVAKHPLSSWQGRMADATCELPRFDPADDRQAAFYSAAKTCADNAWRGLLEETRLEGDVKVVTVTSTVQTASCGEVDPTSPATQCDGTVYMTPAHLRDTEQNGRYPGRYLGVFLREYAHALQFTTGLSELAGKVTTGSAEDLDKRLAQQATCLAGVASGAMSGRGAIDGNITGEISARLSTVDAPPDAGAWLDKGFQARQPSACNTWAG